MFSSYNNIDTVKDTVTEKHRMCLQDAVTEGS